MARERLQKYLARCGHGSRRRAELLIEKGLVYVNGEVAELGISILPGKDEVVLHGEKVQPPKHMTIMFHKTAGTITSTHDTHDRLTVMDMLPKRVVDAGVLPAGRLDLETEERELAYRESMRKLYVAMTRAGQKLVLFSTEKLPDSLDHLVEFSGLSDLLSHPCMKNKPNTIHQ